MLIPKVFILSRLNGSSSNSETYGNPCLANSKDFEVKEVEVYTLSLSLSCMAILTLTCRISKI